MWPSSTPPSLRVSRYIWMALYPNFLNWKLRPQILHYRPKKNVFFMIHQVPGGIFVCTVNEEVLWVFWMSLARNNLYRLPKCLISWGQFHQHSTRSLYVCKLRPQLFCAHILGLYFTGVSLPAQKLCVERWWNWPLVRRNGVGKWLKTTEAQVTI